MDIKYVKDNEGNNFFPLVHEKGVVDDNGTTLESKLQHKQDEITTVTVNVDNSTGTPSGSASMSGGTLSLNFSNIKGEKGDTGAQGIQGLQGERGLPGESGVTGDVSEFTVIQTIEPSATYGATDIAGAASLQATNQELTELAGKFTDFELSVGDAWKIESQGRIANGVWRNDFAQYKHIVIPIYSGDNVQLVPNSFTYYTVLKDYPKPVAGETPQFATGYSDRVTLSSTKSFIAPSDAKWLYVQSRDGNTSRLPSSITINGIEKLVDNSTSNAISILSRSVIDKLSSPVRLYPQTKLPCVSFQFDNIPANDAQIVSLFESYGLTCAFSFVASEANITAKAETYKEYQSRGFQIMNNSVDGTIFNITNYTYQTALTTIMTALNRLQNVRMVCNGFVSPSSSMATEFLPILKLAHAYAFTTATSSATANGRNQDTCQLHRYNLQSHTLSEIEQYIDDCITNDQIMTFYGHAANLVADGDTSVFSLAKIAAVIEYCIAKRDTGLLYVGGTDDCVKYFFDLT